MFPTYFYPAACPGFFVLRCIGYSCRYGSDVLANFTDFLEALNSKDLEWFEKNFKKGVDNIG